MILDTKLPDISQGSGPKPATQLSCYLLDADLANLGRDDFFLRLQEICTESGADYAEELKRTLTLLSNHRWLTEPGRLLYEEGKEKNLKALRRMVQFNG